MLGGCVSRQMQASVAAMRPALLDKLFAPVTALPGIGPQLARLIERAAGPLVVDLLWHLPTGLVDRRAAPPIGALNPVDWPDAVVTLKATVERHQPGLGRRPYRVICSDGSGTLTLVYFNVKGDYLERLLPVGAERIVSGRVEYYGGLPQIAHPDYVVPPSEAERVTPIEPVYPLTAGLASRVVAAGGRRRTGARPGTARMARPGLAGAAPMAGLAHGDRGGARAAQRGRSRPREPGARAPRL